jgi:hypothetical protein
MAGQSLHGTRSGRQSDRDARPVPYPPAPGAVSLPHRPGQVPGRSTVPGHFSVPIPRAPVGWQSQREEGTTQGIMGVFQPDADGTMTPARFEQATASHEEFLKAVPADLPPNRPLPGYTRIADDAPAAALPAVATRRF